MTARRKRLPPGILTREVRGPLSRFRVESMSTRFGGVEWFLLDAEAPDPETGLPSVVGQGTEAEVEARYQSLAAEVEKAMSSAEVYS